MAQIKADEITQLLRQQIENYDAKIEVDEVGTILSLGDGIARLHGLDKVMYGELLEFPHGIAGLAMNLEEDQVGSVLLGDYTHLREGDQVKRTGKILSVPVGDAMIGRVVNALGQPIDDKGPIASSENYPVERLAPGVVDRQPVREPMTTGLKAIDSMIPIGRGQRELIIGDRQTGKTAVALDTIINSAKNNLICIYCAVGQKRSSVAQVVQTLTEHGAMDYTVVVAATASEPAPMLYIPTNVISITDGQIYLETDLFNSGVRPAVNVGLSVSRVGGSAQIKAMRQVAGTLKLDLAQYRELAAFSQFGSDLDKVTLKQLNRGKRLTELLKQPQFSPLPTEKQVIIIYAGNNGFLDDLEVEQIRSFEDGLYKYLDSAQSALLSDIITKKTLDDDLKARIDAALKEYKQNFVADQNAAKQPAGAAK
jgi:F0F1-type ATP synthase alpha subunit